MKFRLSLFTLKIYQKELSIYQKEIRQSSRAKVSSKKSLKFSITQKLWYLCVKAGFNRVHFHAELIGLHLLMQSYVIGVSQLDVIVVHNICVPVSGVVSQFQEPIGSFTSVTLE